MGLSDLDGCARRGFSFCIRQTTPHGVMRGHVGLSDLVACTRRGLCCCKRQTTRHGVMRGDEGVCRSQ